MSFVNGAVFLVAVLALICLVAIPWALFLDRRDWSEAHLLHGPNDGCLECENK